eukprot:12635.XXX_680196_691581_1 [CDS] Oithona nana genome sequencing.
MSGGSNRTSLAPSPEDQDQDGNAGNPNPDSISTDQKCTASRVKTVIKNIFAQLFSHAGLFLLVIGYSLMGAVLFRSLEGKKEEETKFEVEALRNSTLDDLYSITDFLRLEVLIQEKTIAKLQESVKSLTILNRKCDRQSRKNRKFLQTLIQQTKTDNVPLTEDQCSKLCNEHKVKGADCDTLCISKRVQCAHWPDTSKCLKHTGKGSNRRKKRETDVPATEIILSPKHTGSIENTRSSLSSNVINVTYSSDLFIRRWSSRADCKSITCTQDSQSETTFCFQKTSPHYYFQFSEDPAGQTKKFNVLWRQNWTIEAKKKLSEFEGELFIKFQSAGYKGEGENEQWSFPGALLYAVTVISTIGYGHITPKTVGGKIVTMIYAIGGMPLFFLWMAQTGELMANVFKVLYYSVFCGLCRRAKRRKAAALQAAKNEKEKEEAKETIIDTTSIDLESEMPFSEGGAVKVLAATPLQLAHNLINTTNTIDSGVHSQQSLNKSVKIEILQPEVKDLLSTCAKYNLENAKNHDSRSAEILEEIRHAEAIEKEKQQLKKADKNSDSISTYENSPLKKAKTLVAMDMNGTPVTTLLRDGSPASTRKTAEKLATQQSQQTVDEIPNRIPVFMVVIILFGYITVGAIIFSQWEGWPFLDGFYFSFITLTTIGFGDFVPGEKLLKASPDDGNAQLMLAVLYLLMGMALLSMSIQLMQDTIREKAVELAIEMGIM